MITHSGEHRPRLDRVAVGTHVPFSLHKQYLWLSQRPDRDGENHVLYNLKTHFPLKKKKGNKTFFFQIRP